MATSRSVAWICALSVVICARSADLAPSAEYEGKPIAEIRFEPSLQPVSRADIERLLNLQPGKPLFLEDIRTLIKRLYATGRYSTIEVAAEPAPNGVAVVIRTTEQWFVGPVEVRGKVSSPPNEGQLANASRLNLGEPFDDENLPGAVKSLETLLQRNGLFLSKVSPRVERDAEHQQVAVTFDVESGKRARFVLPVVIGDTRLPPEDLAKTAKYKGWWFLRWRYATEENTERGLDRIRAKYQDEDRLTASVSLADRQYLSADNRVRPVIRADGGPKVKITAAGADVSEDTLKKYVPVFIQGAANRDLLVRGVANLRDYFQNRGYFDVLIDFQTTQVDPDHEEITYLISQGPRQKLADVQIQGNQYFTTEEIRERMYLEPAGLIRLRRGRYSDGLAERDRESIRSLYVDNGFREVEVTTRLINDYQGEAGEVAAVFTINEGPQYLVSKLDVEGISIPDREQILERLASVPGQPFSGANVALDREYLLNIYFSSGYPDAAFDWQLIPQPGRTEVAIRYKITEGAPRYIRDVLVTGLRDTSPRLVQPNILLAAGDPLSWTRMGFMQRRLYNLGVFDKVDMAIQNPRGDTENKYVLYHLTEGHRYHLGIGFGAEVARIGGSQTTLDNPAGATGFAPRASLQVSRMNMFGLGHSLNFNSRYSSLSRRLSLNYLAPRYRNVEGRNFSVTGQYDNTRDVLTFTARRLEAAGQFSQRFSRATTGFLRYSWRHVRVDENTLKINPLLIPLVSQPSRVGMFAWNIVRDRRDDPTDAHRGMYQSLDLGLAQKGFGGNRDFLRLLGRNSYYKPYGRNHVLAFNTQFGWIKPFNVTAGVTPFDYIPIAERYFGGGSTSHRGFPDNQAGPRDPLTGFPLGGNALFFHSSEWRFPLLGDNIDGVLFHDLGNIFSSLDAISFRVRQKSLTDFDYMVHAAGFGVRYRTPVGPVRVDLAYSINPPRFNGLEGTYQELLFGTARPAVKNVRKFQFFISIGQAF